MLTDDDRQEIDRALKQVEFHPAEQFGAEDFPLPNVKRRLLEIQVEETEWDFSIFLRDGKESFCKSYKGYDR